MQSDSMSSVEFVDNLVSWLVRAVQWGAGEQSCCVLPGARTDMPGG